MTERNFLCKCTFCLNENINGKILNQNTFNRHRTIIQEFSERDDENMYIEENIHLDMEENIHLDAEKNIHLNMEENIYLDTEENIYLNTEENIHLDTEEEQIEKNIGDDSDTESFNFNEEDIEYYSDYNNDDDNNNDNKNMQIDNETNISNKKIIEGLKLLYLKSLYNFIESAYDNIMKIF